MLSIHLNYYQRICLWNLAGMAQVPNLLEAEPVLKLIEKFKPTDQEMLDTQFRLEEQRGYIWISPSPNYGDIDIALTLDEQKKLIWLLENQQGVKVADASWQLKLVAQLKPEPVTQEIVPA